MYMSKSLEYYYNKVKNNPVKMEERRLYYKTYYRNNKNSYRKEKKEIGIVKLYGTFLLFNEKW